MSTREEQDRGIALVTGAGSGIGHAIAVRLSQESFRIIAVGRRKKLLDDLVTALPAPAIALVADIARDGSEILSALPAPWQRINVLINNAGSDVGGRKPFHKGDMPHWRNTIETNVVGLMKMTREVLPGMVERRSGHIVNIGSSVVHRSYAGSVAYAASKSAVHALSDCLRAEHTETGIRVTEILPGVVRTDFDAVRNFGDPTAAKSFYDGFGVVLQPDDIARAVMFALDQPAGVVIAQMTILPTSDW